MNAQYRVIYRVDRGRPSDFTDVECVVGHRPNLGCVERLPDGDCYGRVISVVRIKQQPQGLA